MYYKAQETQRGERKEGKNNNSPRHVSGGGEDTGIIQEAARGQITGVPLEFLAHPDISFTGLEAVDGADVVQTSAGNKAARGGIGTSHHPARPERDGMDLGR